MGFASIALSCRLEVCHIKTTYLVIFRPQPSTIQRFTCSTRSPLSHEYTCHYKKIRYTWSFRRWTFFPYRIQPTFFVFLFDLCFDRGFVLFLVVICVPNLLLMCLKNNGAPLPYTPWKKYRTDLEAMIGHVPDLFEWQVYSCERGEQVLHVKRRIVLGWDQKITR